MKYGCRAHDYGCFTAQELARTLADQGYNAAQLAMPKAIRGIADMNGISPEQLEEIRTAFAEADVEITVLSCYRDLSSPDDGTRTAAVADVCRALHYQKATGAKQVGSESSCRFLTEEQKAAELPLLTDSILRIVEQAAKLDACRALKNSYHNGLMCGYLDSEEALPEFLEKLEQAGIQEILQAKQSALDNWLNALH